MENIFNIADWRQQHVKSVMLITESDARIDRAKKIIRTVFSGAVDLEGRPLNLDAYVTDENQRVNDNPKTTLLDYLLYSVRHDFEIMSNSSASLVPIVTKLAFKDLNYQRENADLDGLQNLHRIVLMLLKDTSSEEYNWFINKGTALQYREVYKYFKQKLDDQDKADADSANNATGLVRNTHYRVIPINSMREAKPWGKYTGHGQDGRPDSPLTGKLCYTDDSKIWRHFTVGNTRQCFLLLRDDWKEVPREKTEGYPKDSWGLSMVWVFIDKSTGILGNSNVRWNHGDGTFSSVDNMFTASEISKLLGMTFKQAFGIEIDHSHLKKSVRALFEKSPTYDYRVFLENIVPVYKGVTFKDKETGKNYYARNADNVYPIPESFTENIERDAKTYVTKLNSEDGLEVYSFEDLRVRKGTIADVPKDVTQIHNGVLNIVDRDNVPGLNGILITIHNFLGDDQYVYLPKTGSPTFCSVERVEPVYERVLQINQIYILNSPQHGDSTVIFDAKSQTLKAFSNEELAKYLTQFKDSDVSSDEAKRFGVVYLGKNMCLVKGLYEVWVSNSKVSYEFDGLLNFNEKFAYFYRSHDGNSVDDLEFFRLNCNTGELETIGKGLETLHKIWTIFNGTVNILSDYDINILDIRQLFDILTYKDDELGTYAILSVGDHNKQVWMLKTGKILPEPGKFYYAATQAYGHNVFVKNNSKDTLHKISLLSKKDKIGKESGNDSLTEIRLVDLIFGKYVIL